MEGVTVGLQSGTREPCVELHHGRPVTARAPLTKTTASTRVTSTRKVRDCRTVEAGSLRALGGPLVSNAPSKEGRTEADDSPQSP